MTEEGLAPTVRIEAWSDVACPWCWLGKRHLEEAARREGIPLELELRSFELNPQPRASEPAKPYLARRLGGEARVAAAHERLAAMGRAVGLAYDFDRALVANTFDAHRVHHLAKARGRGDAVVERFLRAYHAEGADLADHATLRRLASEAGLWAAEVDEVLASDRFAKEVRTDQAAAIGLGISGVPFFVIEGKWAVSGAQPVEAFAQALRQVHAAMARDAPPG